MLVLFETPTRFAVFKVLNKGKLDKIKSFVFIFVCRIYGRSSRDRTRRESMVAKMQQPHALFRWASSARWLQLVEFGTVSCCCLCRAMGPSLLRTEPTSPVAGASSSRPSCFLPKCLCLLPRVVRFLLSLSFDSSRMCMLVSGVIPVLEAVGSSMRFAVPFISVCSRRGWLCSCWCRTRAPSGTDMVLWRSLMNKPRCSYFQPLMLYTHIYTCLPLDWFCLTHKVSSCGKAETSSPTVEEKDDDNDQAQVTRNKRMKWQA